MTLANPMALWWLALALPVAAFFFFRVRPVEVEVPALALWDELTRAADVHSFGIRFGRWPTLLVQLLIVGLLVFTLADPHWGAARRGIVIVLDDSATMQTRDATGRTRFDLAKAAVMDRIRGAGENGVAAVVLAGEPVRLAGSRETDRRGFEGRIERLEPRDVNADLARAVCLASNIGADARSDAIVVYSDKPQPLISEGSPLEWTMVGTPEANIGIAGVRKSDDGRELIVTIHQSGFTGRVAIARLVIDGREVERREIALGSRTVEVALPAPDRDGQPFEIRCDPSDALLLDNVYYGVWTVPKPARVLLVTNGNLPLLAALRQPGLQVESITPEQWTVAHSADVVVLDAPQIANINVTDGCFIVVGGSDPLGLSSSIAPQTDQRPVQWSPDRPILRDVDLLNWRVRRTASMGPSANARIIVGGANAPLVLEARKPAPQPNAAAKSLAAVLVNFDLRDSNLATRASFPIFMWNAVQDLLGRSDGRDVAVATGAPARIPSQARGPIRIMAPRGEPCEGVAETNEVVILQPDCAGIYHVEGGADREAVAVNWVPNGTDAPKSAQLVRSTSPSHAIIDTWLQPLWSRVLAVAAIVIVMELILFHFGILRLG